MRWPFRVEATLASERRDHEFVVWDHARYQQLIAAFNRPDNPSLPELGQILGLNRNQVAGGIARARVLYPGCMPFRGYRPFQAKEKPPARRVGRPRKAADAVNKRSAGMQIENPSPKAEAAPDAEPDVSLPTAAGPAADLPSTFKRRGAGVAPPPVGVGKTWIPTRRAACCQWPTENPAGTSPRWTFCEAPVAEHSKVYCEEHHALAFTGLPVRLERYAA